MENTAQNSKKRPQLGYQREQNILHLCLLPHCRTLHYSGRWERRINMELFPCCKQQPASMGGNIPVMGMKYIERKSKLKSREDNMSENQKFPKLP